MTKWHTRKGGLNEWSESQCGEDCYGVESQHGQHFVDCPVLEVRTGLVVEENSQDPDAQIHFG